MADTVTSTALPALCEGRHHRDGRPANIAVPVSTDGSMDCVALYRQFCAEEGCKANSAFLRYLQGRGGHFSLECLNLGNNYLGPKGLRPVLRMIDLCETTLSLNLQKNGIDNDAVMDLCKVLQRHGGIASLNLSYNPISVSGGKRLLQLVEENPRITELLLTGTHIFEGLQSRIRMALQHNAAVQLGSGPKMETNKEVASPAVAAKAAGSRPSSRQRGVPAVVATLPAIPPPKATFKVTYHRPRSSDKAVADGSSAGAAASEPSSRYTRQEVVLGKPQPRPPLPDVAPQEHKAFPLSKVKDLKALFAERARLLMEVNRGEASRRAYAVRQELLALVRHSQPTGAPTSSAQPRTYPGTATPSTPLLGPLPNVNEEDTSTTHITSGGENASVHTSAAPHLAVPSGGEIAAEVEPSDSARAAHLAATDVSVTDHSASAMVVGARSAGAGLVGGTAETVPAERPEAHTIEDALVPARMMLLTTEEKLTVLFDQGCREYMNRNLDAAYMAWNEAMRVAVSEGQREWIAVVASNLQRLSYELLVEEGASHLERGQLEKARDTFNLAYDVATKAKNAAWERDVRAAQQNVQKALFHRCHEAALLLFRRAQEDMSGGIASTTVTEDDYFVLPGTEEMVHHTAAFVREWSCLLLLKEAIGLWVEATRVIARLSEVAAAPLRESVKEAVSLVAAFIAEHHFNATSPESLTWFGTDAYLYHERILLSELWYDLVAYSEQNLRHGLLNAICAAQLGELYVATFQLPQALVQLNKLVTYGRAHQLAVLEATGLTLCGRVHLQRADYALAEAALDDALRLWTELRSDPAVKVLADGRDTGAWHRYDVALMDASAVTADESAVASTQMTVAHESAANAPAKAAVVAPDRLEEVAGTITYSCSSSTRFRIEAHLPTDAVVVLANMCRHYKVCLLLRTYRYSAALEALENSLNEAYSDTLREKLGRNFHLNPSIDEIAAIAGVLKTPLVFYTLTTKYDWAVMENVYMAEESLCMWVVAEPGEMRFVEVNLTKDFRCTLRGLITSLRQRLGVDPEMAVQTDIITELPSRSWQEPLRVLYQACIHPIIGYVRALDSQLLFGDGMITVVPSGQMWLVPFHALLNVKAGDRYFVEEAAVQMAFSATQAAFAALSAVRVQQQNLHREVVAVQCDADHDAADTLFCTAFPPNTDRSEQEGAAVVAMLSAGQVQLAEWLGRHSTPEKVVTRKVELVENVESLRTVLPRARTVHIATATTAAAPLSQAGPVDRTASRPEDEGGLLMRTAARMGNVGLVRAAEIAHMEVAAEHVILTNTNMSPQHMDGIRDDVLGLVRGFFGSGVPCVIAGQWCTPDMKPIELFRHFYEQWCRALRTSQAESSVHVVTATGDCVSPSCAQPTGALQPQRIVGEEGPEEDGEMVRHRALLLARSIRHLLVEEPAMRYRPRVWAGYYCIGSGR